MARLRIAYARINQETNCFSPVLTTLEDFQRTHLREGDELAAGCARWGNEAPGFTRNAELSGFVRGATREGRGEVELVPTLSAWAIPGGPLSRACYDNLVDRLTTRLRKAWRLDGVYLSLHGAMGVEGMRDADTELVRAVRSVVGNVPIGATFDLHANTTAARMDALELVAAYRTNPHRDHAAVGARMASLLLGTVRGELKPVQAWRALPLLLGGGTTVDLLAPMRSVFARMREMERRDGALSTSLFTCHVWNSDPSLGWSVVAATNGDKDLAERLADELAERAWALRLTQPPAFPSALEAITQAREARLARRTGVVMLADASDVVSAGAPGENTRLLAALLEHASDLVSYVPLRDPAAVELLWSVPVGERVSLPVGGRLDPARGSALTVTGRVQRKHTAPGFLRMVVLDLGGVKLVLTEGPAFAAMPSFYTQVGLSVWAADVVVAKNFFPFRMYFLPYARKTIYVKTHGATDLDLAFELAFDTPVYPRDPVDDWREGDRVRRVAKTSA